MAEGGRTRRPAPPGNHGDIGVGRASLPALETGSVWWRSPRDEVIDAAVEGEDVEFAGGVLAEGRDVQLGAAAQVGQLAAGDDPVALHAEAPDPAHVVVAVDVDADQPGQVLAAVDM